MEISPANGSPQRSQNGGRRKRTCDQHSLQTSPSLGSARCCWQSWQSGGYSKSSPALRTRVMGKIY
jgi:hypothetical protein